MLWNRGCLAGMLLEIWPGLAPPHSHARPAHPPTRSFALDCFFHQLHLKLRACQGAVVGTKQTASVSGHYCSINNEQLQLIFTLNIKQKTPPYSLRPCSVLLQTGSAI